MPLALASVSLTWLRVGVSWVLLAIGLLVGLFFFWKKAREEHFEMYGAVDSLVIASLWAAVAARVSFVLLQASQFQFRPMAWINVLAFPGMWAPAGLVVFFAVLWWRADKIKQDYWELWDFSSILLTWFLLWHWLSRFVLGAAAGIPTQLPWGVVFPLRVEPAHPVQLYAAAFYALGFAVLWWVEPRYRFFLWYRSKKRTAKTGFLFCVFLIVTGLQGIVTSIVQYPFVLIWDIDLNQIVSVIVFFVGLLLLYSRSGRTLFFASRKSTDIERKS
jgi:phosphatidylglycerol:prolipoprotein diacylglycerol transferase